MIKEYGQATLVPFVFAIWLASMITDSYGQNYDSLRQRILDLEINQQNIQLNLNRAHKRYKAGTVMVVVGAIITTAGLLLPTNSGDDVGSGQASPFVIIGGSLLAVGTMSQIDAHRFIGKASRKKQE